MYRVSLFSRGSFRRGAVCDSLEHAMQWIDCEATDAMDRVRVTCQRSQWVVTLPLPMTERGTDTLADIMDLALQHRALPGGEGVIIGY